MKRYFVKFINRHGKIQTNSFDTEAEAKHFSKVLDGKFLEMYQDY